MSQNITINGNNYANVKQIKAPKTDSLSEFAVFPDTSDANASADKILKSFSGYVNGIKVVGNIESIEAQEITPTTTEQTIPAKKYLNGTQTVKGDSNLLAENIIKGVSIFGVEGNASSATFSLSEGILSSF